MVLAWYWYDIGMYWHLIGWHKFDLHALVWQLCLTAIYWSGTFVRIVMTFACIGRAFAWQWHTLAWYLHVLVW